MRVFDGGDANEIIGEARSEELAKCVVTAGHIAIKFYKPKGDELKKGDWSTDVMVNTIRPKVVTDGMNGMQWPMEQAQALCPVKALYRMSSVPRLPSHK